MTAFTIPQKTCTTCHSTKNLTDFVKEPRNRSGRGAQCVKCHNDYYHKDNPERQKTHQDCAMCKQLLTVDQFEYIRKKTSGRSYCCKSCRTTIRSQFPPDTQFRECSHCHILKPFQDFWKSKTKAHNIGSYCKQCGSARIRTPRSLEAKRAYYHKHRDKNIARAKRQREILKTNPDWQRIRRNEFLCQRFGITIEQYDQMAQEQHGVCAICQQPPPKQSLSVDHCHSTGKIRGLLCTICNAILGRWKDNPECALNAVQYLQNQGVIYSHSTTPSQPLVSAGTAGT